MQHLQLLEKKVLSSYFRPDPQVVTSKILFNAGISIDIIELNILYPFSYSCPQYTSNRKLDFVLISIFIIC